MGSFISLSPRCCAAHARAPRIPIRANPAVTRNAGKLDALNPWENRERMGDEGVLSKLKSTCYLVLKLISFPKSHTPSTHNLPFLGS